MKYGKLINGTIEYCTTDILVSNGVTYINPSEETILSLGWMPVVESEDIRTDEIVDGRIFHYSGVLKTLDDVNFN